MLKQAYDAGATAALSRYGLSEEKLAATRPVAFKPAPAVQGPGFFQGAQQHGSNLISGLKGWLGGPRIDPNFKGPQSQLRKDLIAGRDAARGQVWESAKGLAPAAAIAGLGAYTLLRDSPEEAAVKRYGVR
jgi:hypothetical protein